MWSLTPQKVKDTVIAATLWYRGTPVAFYLEKNWYIATHPSRRGVDRHVKMAEPLLYLGYVDYVPHIPSTDTSHPCDESAEGVVRMHARQRTYRN